MFRFDINGLRFIAVSMVVLFHFKFSGFYGGYAGVDVFFVISGFLMQEICSREIGKKGWVTNFYKKRFKRIYPALLFAVCFTFFLILYSETPKGVDEGFHQALSALTFTSNIYYWLFTGGYFSTTSEFNWFLHTWSLSVEWQYYLIFPIALWLSSKFKEYNWIVYLFLIATSLFICVHFGPNHSKANFYLLPTRIWELMTGALVSTLKVRNKIPRITEIASIAALILFTLFTKDSDTWPNMETIIPVIATALLLQANIGNEKTILRGFIFQKIGSASYSIYLFHWPIIAFMANNAIEFTLLNSVTGLFTSVILGFFSYNYLESFFIKNGKSLIASTFIFTALFFILNKIGISKMWTPDAIIELDNYKNYITGNYYNEQFGLNIGKCFISSVNEKSVTTIIDKKCIEPSTNKRNILLIGDSHAAEISGSMRRIFNGYNVMQATASGCMPLLKTTGEKRCTNLMNYMYNDFIRNNKIDYIFISAFWGLSNDKNIDKNLIDTINHIHGSKVYVIGQTKSFDIAFYKIAQKIKNKDIEALVQKKSIDINQKLITTLKKENIPYIDLFNANCIKNECNYFNANNTPMLFDDNHLTKEWSDIYVDIIKIQSGL
ncbi:TPA: acyltransferase [Klebsiella pneumoniae]|uniref:acyltransferase family protein n=1 Tax=Klebsiella variicola TaxID=244366 RepID=UPI0024067C13|nr:acyltransferase family protein [Klebsiella variicola]MDG0346714.1 acyltransferase [Klebsiella variicola]MDG0347306.1 acyltransferase [Klebsiella variicola]HBX7941115.1 acyltransferase [Klebsiella pneumoniae]